MKLVAFITIVTVSAVIAKFDLQEEEFSWNRIRDIDDGFNEFQPTEHTIGVESGVLHVVASFFQPIFQAFRWQLSAPAVKHQINDTNLPYHVRVKRAKRRKLIVKCCGQQSCTDVSSSNIERSSDRRKKQDEAEFVNDLQYSRPKKKRKKSGTIDLTNLQAFGVFTDNGIHISCAGCPAGWPDMLTVYPEYEIGIPVSCSNCPNNWPGALNLLGMGGDSSWQQRPQSSGGRNPGRGRGGNNFNAFDANSNFGGRPGIGGNVFPPPDFNNNFGGGGGGYDDEDYADTPPPRRRSKKNNSTGAPVDDERTSEATPKDNKNDEEDSEDDDQDEDSSPGLTTTPSSAAATASVTNTSAAAEDDDEEEEDAAVTKATT